MVLRGGMTEDGLGGPAGLGETDVVGCVLQRDVRLELNPRLVDWLPDLHGGVDVSRGQGSSPVLQADPIGPAELSYQLPGWRHAVGYRHLLGGRDLQGPGYILLSFRNGSTQVKSRQKIPFLLKTIIIIDMNVLL